MSRRFAHAATIATACGVLFGCASPPVAVVAPEPAPQDPPPPQIVVLPQQPTAYELRQRDLARQLAREGRLADAALIWEVLTTIRPKVAEYRAGWDEVRRQIDSRVAERVQQAEQAAARGQLDTAAQHYLSALALQPSNSKAADAMRGIERERNKRNHLGKLSRQTMTRRAVTDAEVPVDATAMQAPLAPAAPRR